VLAKAETGEHIEVTAARLPRDVPVVALIETAIGLANVREVARSPATLRLAFGSGDFCRDTGISADPLSLAYPRSQLVIASRVERIAPPIDGPTTTTDDEVLLSATATGRAAGTCTVGTVGAVRAVVKAVVMAGSLAPTPRGPLGDGSTAASIVAVARVDRVAAPFCRARSACLPTG